MNEYSTGNSASAGEPNYWQSVGIASLIFGIIIFAISMISGYIQINSEPSGSILSPMTLFSIVTCLIGAFGGMAAVWHFANEYDTPMKLGKGALIGFLTGVGITIMTIILSQFWELIDPDYTEKLVKSAIANIEEMDLPGDAKQQMIDQTASSVESNQSIFWQLVIGIPLYGILNLLTGMIGVKVFAKQEEQF